MHLISLVSPRVVPEAMKKVLGACLRRGLVRFILCMRRLWERREAWAAAESRTLCSNKLIGRVPGEGAVMLLRTPATGTLYNSSLHASKDDGWACRYAWMAACTNEEPRVHRTRVQKNKVSARSLVFEPDLFLHLRAHATSSVPIRIVKFLYHNKC